MKRRKNKIITINVKWQERACVKSDSLGTIRHDREAIGLKAVIFDLDGTLIDSMMVWEQVSRDYLRNHGIHYAGNIGSEVKNMSLSQSACYHREKFNIQATNEQIIDEWKALARQAYAETIPLKEGVRPFLDKLRKMGLKLAVATATDRDLVELVLSRHKILEYFVLIVTVQEVGVGKERPEFFRIVAEKLGEKPEDCLFFDDCPHAVGGAKKAGMSVWAVYDECSAHERPELERIADGYIERFTEFDIIKEIG